MNARNAIHNWTQILESFLVFAFHFHIWREKKFCEMSIAGSFYRNKTENDRVDFCIFLPGLIADTHFPVISQYYEPRWDF